MCLALCLTGSLILGPAEADADVAWWDDPGPDAIDQRLGGADWAGRIRWDHGYIEVAARATADPKLAVNAAHGETLALKAARYLAFEKLLEVIAGVRLDSATVVRRELLQDGLMRARVKGLVRRARTVMERVETKPDGSPLAEVRLGVLLDGPEGLKAAAWQAYRDRLAAADPDLDTPRPKPAQVSAPMRGQPTGLIVIARGLGAKPAMFPRLLAEPGGEELFGPAMVSPRAAMDKGVVGYAPDLAKARANPRVGANPLVVRANKAQGPGSSDLMVTSTDAARITAAEAAGDILTNCNVVIVIQ
jgi:hypothetical protein